MSKVLVYTETLITSLEPERTLRLADECLVDIRAVEERNVSNAWIYEYEIKGEAGKMAKFFSRIKDIETGE
ncbi:MAG: hypothetical protein K6U80_00490 [Firmicutes bacterium]|nr:hypothetical protein [Bacillota bacterium]